MDALIDNFIVRFILATLAVMYITSAFALETGPLAILDNGREWVIKRWGHESWQAKFVRCPICQSFWAGLVASFVCFPPVLSVAGIINFLLIGVAIAGLAMIVFNVIYSVH